MTNLSYERLAFTCPCCGFVGLKYRPYANASGVGLIRGLTPPYDTYFGDPSYEVCACCGFEFGNDDSDPPPTSFEESLLRFVARNELWLDPKKKPLKWSLQEQLYNAAIQVK